MFSRWASAKDVSIFENNAAKCKINRKNQVSHFVKIFSRWTSIHLVKLNLNLSQPFHGTRIYDPGQEATAYHNPFPNVKF